MEFLLADDVWYQPDARRHRCWNHKRIGLLSICEVPETLHWLIDSFGLGCWDFGKFCWVGDDECLSEDLWRDLLES